MAYNTGNAIGSADARDLYDNAANLDAAMNSSAATWTDRFGVSRPTFKGAESELNQKVGDAEAAATEARGYLNTMRATSYGPLAEDPTTDPLGNPCTAGDEYFNTTYNLLKRFDGSIWRVPDINTENLASGAGSSMVGHGGQTVEAALNERLPEIGTYALLRAYTGPVTAFFVQGVANSFDGGFGVFRVDASDTTTADNGGTVLVDASGRRWKRLHDGLVNVRWFGAVGDGSADDTDAIKLAIAHASRTPVADRRSCVVYFPSGIYKISSTLVVRANGVELRGEYETGANTNESPTGHGGTHIYYTADDGQPAILVGGESGKIYYGNGITGIRVGAIAGLENKPIGIQLAGLSEVTLKDFHINGGCSVGLNVISCTIITVNNFDIAECQTSLRISADSASYFFNLCSFWISNGNFWNATHDHVQISCNTSDGCVFRDVWMEYAQNMFYIGQVSDQELKVKLILDNVETSVAVGYSPNDPTYNIANNRFVKARAMDGATNKFEFYFDMRGCTTYVENATYAIQYIKGTNSNFGSRICEATVANSHFYGVQTAAAHSDTSISSVFCYGRMVVSASIFTQIDKPFSAGLLQLHTLNAMYGYWDMSAGRPLRLPQQAPIDYAISGQVFFNNELERPAYSANGSLYSLQKPRVLILADQNYSFNNTTDPDTVIFNSPLSGVRSIDFNTTNTFNGQKVRVTRSSAATGASALAVLGPAPAYPELKYLSVGQWCDIESDGSSWYVTAFGSL